MYFLLNHLNAYFIVLNSEFFFLLPRFVTHCLVSSADISLALLKFFVAVHLTISSSLELFCSHHSGKNSTGIVSEFFSSSLNFNDCYLILYLCNHSALGPISIVVCLKFLAFTVHHEAHYVNLYFLLLIF